MCACVFEREREREGEKESVGEREGEKKSEGERQTERESERGRGKEKRESELEILKKRDCSSLSHILTLSVHLTTHTVYSGYILLD